jgi:riboflavin biosynthesis pyrimidine reductase
VKHAARSRSWSPAQSAFAGFRFPAEVIVVAVRAGLVDELNLLIHPIVIGGGAQRLFEDDGPQIPLALAHTATFSTGVTHAVYHKA